MSEKEKKREQEHKQPLRPIPRGCAEPEFQPPLRRSRIRIVLAPTGAEVHSQGLPALGDPAPGTSGSPSPTSYRGGRDRLETPSAVRQGTLGRYARVRIILQRTTCGEHGRTTDHLW